MFDRLLHIHVLSTIPYVLNVNIPNAIETFIFFQLISRDLLRALRKKRPQLVENTENIVFHHDNAPCHTSEHTQLSISILGFQQINHSPYSPDLAPLDFAFFTYLKKQLRGRRFDGLEDLKGATLAIIKRMDSSWFQSMFNKWLHRYEKCINHNGEYFEKE